MTEPPDRSEEPTVGESDLTSAGAVSHFGFAPGDRIGVYRVLSRLGEGGFGVVYLAERREPYRQRVAVKVIKPGMDSDASIARFEQERQAMAIMEHPNVAHLLDAGITDDEHPYFVMEYVKGEPITSYCDRLALSLEQRLRLFVPVCEAVYHAHLRGVIHRDIKPSNVLVAHPPEGRAAREILGIPKVIDFGVAKAINQLLTEKTIYTETGQIVGTPEYMSPEQADMQDGSVDTRTDVYALGVLLYELLVGAPPFDPQSLRSKGMREIQRIVREVDPPRPSIRVTQLGDAAERNADNRRTLPQALVRDLRREVEWIPMRAMQKKRADRYQTPIDIATDILAYLAGEPIAAAPTSVWQRARRRLWRHRLVLVALGISLVSMGIGAFVVWLMLRD